MHSHSKTQIRTAEEILALTRQMQELWLFGQLNTVQPQNGDSTTEFAKTEDRARTLAELVQEAVRGLGVGEGSSGSE